MKYPVTLIPGDGIGPEVTEAMRRCVEATGVDIQWDVQDGGTTAYQKTGKQLPDALLESLRLTQVGIKGPTQAPIGMRSANVALRKHFDLYANIRPIRYHPGVSSRILNPTGIDFTIFRENIEDLYAGIEFAPSAAITEKFHALLATHRQQIPRSSAVSIKYFSAEGCERIARSAFEYARINNRKKVTAIAKDNIMPITDGMFINIASTVGKEYHGIEFTTMIIDNACQQAVMKPEQFDVVVMPNLYGDIFSDLAAGLVGGLGVAPGANIGAKCAVFEAVHGTAPDIAGKGIANPTALTLSGAMLLRHIGEPDAASRLERAIDAVLAEGIAVTGDLKPQARGHQPVGTYAMADAIIAKL